MSVRYHENYIRRVPLFASLPAHHLEPIMGSFVSRRFSAGDMILVQGTVPTGLYILLQGQAAWVQTALNGTANQLGMMQIGQHIHDEALLRDDVVDTASLQAISTTSMLILSRKDLRGLLMKRPELQAALGVTVALPKTVVKPKPAPKQKAVKAEAETIRVGSVSPFLSSFDTSSGASVYRKHWSLWLTHISFPAFLCVVGFGAMLSLIFGNPNPELASAAWAMSGGILFFSLAWFFTADWLWRNDFYFLSDSHIVLAYRPSLFGKRETETIALQNLKDVQMLPPSIWQRIMAYGDLQVSMMDGTEDVYLEDLAAPMLMQREIVRRHQGLIRQQAQDTDRREREAINKFKNIYEENQPKPPLPYDYPEITPRPSPFGQPRPKTGEISAEQNLPANPLMPKVGQRPPKFPRRRQP